MIGVKVLDPEKQLRMVGRLIRRIGDAPTSLASACVKRKKRRYEYCLRLVYGVNDGTQLRDLSSRSDQSPRRPRGVPI